MPSSPMTSQFQPTPSKSCKLILYDYATRHFYQSHYKDQNYELTRLSQESMPKHIHIILLQSSQIPRLRLELTKQILTPRTEPMQKPLSESSLEPLEPFWLDRHLPSHQVIYMEIKSRHEDFALSPYLYRVYCLPLKHDFDDEKIYLECFLLNVFSHELENIHAFKNAHIITSTMFLPLVLFAPLHHATTYNMPKALIVWIDEYICYFENGVLRDFKTLWHIHTQDDLDKLADEICLHVNALKLAYHYECEEIYHLSYQANHPDISSTKLRLTPLQSLAAKLGISPNTQDFRLSLALIYYDATFLNQPSPANQLPNFASKPIVKKSLLYPLFATFALFVLIIPFLLSLYTHSLKQSIDSDLAQLHSTQITLDEIPKDLEQDNKQNTITHHTNTLALTLNALKQWQDTYHFRYEFIGETLGHYIAHAEAIRLEEAAFYFTTQSFIATLKLSAQSQLPLSTLHASLNTPNQRTLMLKNSESTPISALDPLAHQATFMLIHTPNTQGLNQPPKGDR